MAASKGGHDDGIAGNIAVIKVRDDLGLSGLNFVNQKRFFNDAAAAPVNHTPGPARFFVSLFRSSSYRAIMSTSACSSKARGRKHKAQADLMEAAITRAPQASSALFHRKLLVCLFIVFLPNEPNFKRL